MLTPEKTTQFIDSAGMKFQVMRELNEDADISFIVIKDNEKPIHYYRGHEYSDGMGVWRDLHQVLYPTDTQYRPDVPVVRTTNKPGRLKRLYFFIKHLWRQRPRNYVYKKSSNKGGRPDGFCLKVFSHEETSALNNKCKKENITLNTLALSSADHVFKELLVNNHPGNVNRVWMLPVNTREHFEKDKQWGNFVTTLSVYLNDNQSRQELNTQIKNMLKSGIIWGGKWVANFPQYLGIEKLRKMSKKEVRAPYLGLVSHMGVWGNSTNPMGTNDKIIIAPTVSKLAPVSIAMFTWNGRLGIGWHLHPVLDVSLNELKGMAANMCSLMVSDGKETCLVESLRWEDIEDNIDLNPINN